MFDAADLLRDRCIFKNLCNIVFDNDTLLANVKNVLSVCHVPRLPIAYIIYIQMSVCYVSRCHIFDCLSCAFLPHGGNVQFR